MLPISPEQHSRFPNTTGIHPGLSILAGAAHLCYFSSEGGIGLIKEVFYCSRCLKSNSLSYPPQRGSLLSRNVHHSGQFTRLEQPAEAQVSKEAAEEPQPGGESTPVHRPFSPKALAMRAGRAATDLCSGSAHISA